MESRKKAELNGYEAARIENARLCERFVLYSIFADNNLIFDAQEFNLQPDQFSKPLHRAIYAEMNKLAAKAFDIDAYTVFENLRKNGTVTQEQAGEILDFAAHTNRVWFRTPGTENSLPGNFEQHARAIQEVFMKKTFIAAAHKVADESQYYGSDPFKMMEAFERSLKPIYDLLNRKTTPDIETLCIETTKAVEAIFQSEKEMTGIPCGIRSIDRMTGGFKKGALHVIAARPGIGKTSFGTTATINILREGYKVGWISAEMTAPALVTRIKCTIAGVSEFDINTKRVGPEVIEPLMHADDWLHKKPLYINDVTGIRVDQVRIQIRQWIVQHQVDVVFIDYLQRIKSESDRHDRTARIEHVTEEITNMAKEFGIAIVAFSQLSREVENIPNKRAELRHFDGASQIEKDAHLAVYLLRPEYYLKDDKDLASFDRPGLCEFGILKHRGGPIGIVDIRYIDPITKFVDWQEAPAPRPVDKVRLPMKEDLDDDMQGFPF